MTFAEAILLTDRIPLEERDARTPSASSRTAPPCPVMTVETVERDLLKSWDDVMERLFPLLHQLLTLAESPSAQGQAENCERLLRENRNRLATPKALLRIMESLTEALSLWQQDTRDKMMMLESSLSQLTRHNKEGLERAYDNVQQKNNRIERLESLELENADLRDQLYVMERKNALHHSLQNFGGVTRQRGASNDKQSCRRARTPEVRVPSGRKVDRPPLYSLSNTPKPRPNILSRSTRDSTQLQKINMSDRFDEDSIYYPSENLR